MPNPHKDAQTADDILLARAHELAKPKRRTTKKTDIRCLEFLLSGMSFAFELESIREILRNDRPITPLRFLPAFFSGLINVRGEVVPLVDLPKYLGLTASSTEEARKSIIIVQKEEIAVGFLCGQIVRIREFSKNELQQSIAAQNELIARLAKGCGRGGLVLLDASVVIPQIKKSLHVE
jgi:chemotaxis signal transduction protein